MCDDFLKVRFLGAFEGKPVLATAHVGIPARFETHPHEHSPYTLCPHLTLLRPSVSVGSLVSPNVRHQIDHRLGWRVPDF